ncbi:MAG: IS66 family insertion sequence element accessory protein TnpB [Cypionkella sp.]
MQTELKLDPHSGVTVVFRSKRGDRLKILVWDGTGMVLIYKVLEQGSFAWPKVQDGTMRLSRAQFEALFEGSGLAADRGATGAAAHCGGMTYRAVLAVFYWAFCPWIW